MQAAFGLAQLERISELVERKWEIFGWYADAFRDCDGLKLNAELAGTKNSYWMSTVVWDRTFAPLKNDVVQEMRARGVDVRPFFHPLSSLPAYAGAPSARCASERNRVSYDIGNRAINLPSGFSLTRGDVDRVSSVLRSVLS